MAISKESSSITIKTNGSMRVVVAVETYLATHKLQP
jgi:hypothetical protein